MFNGNTFNGMVQMVPDVTEEVTQLSQQLPTPQSAVLVYDQEATDYYTRDLRTAFTQDFAKSLTDEAQPYMPDVSDTNVEFQAIADEVCYTSGPAARRSLRRAERGARLPCPAVPGRRQLPR